MAVNAWCSRWKFAKERHESFSAVGGFFRQFEQILVAADERDIVRTRSNARGEDVYLYRLQMNQASARALFLEFLNAANELRQKPRFYNTLTSNCTTIVFELAGSLRPHCQWTIACCCLDILRGTSTTCMD